MKKEMTRKILSLVILSLFLVSLASVVFAADPATTAANPDTRTITLPAGYGQISSFFSSNGSFVGKYILSPISPIGFEDTWTGVIIGFLAMIMIGAILFDVVSLIFPFGTTTNYILAIGFMIAGMVLGLVRSIAGWGLTIGTYFVGAGGALALVMTGVVFFLFIIAFFFGGSWIIHYIKELKIKQQGMKNLESVDEATWNVRNMFRAAKGVTEAAKKEA